MNNEEVNLPGNGRNLPRNYEAMTEDEMNSLLLVFQGTKPYQAMLRYLDLRNGLITNALGTLDPFKSPTEVSRNQGMRLGMYDFPEYLKMLNDKQREVEEGKTHKKNKK